MIDFFLPNYFVVVKSEFFQVEKKCVDHHHYHHSWLEMMMIFFFRYHYFHSFIHSLCLWNNTHKKRNDEKKESDVRKQNKWIWTIFFWFSVILTIWFFFIIWYPLCVCVCFFIYHSVDWVSLLVGWSVDRYHMFRSNQNRPWFNVFFFYFDFFLISFSSLVVV